MTVWVRTGGSALERRQRAIRLERLSKALCSLGFDPVRLQAAGTGDIKVSAAADSLGEGAGQHT